MNMTRAAARISGQVQGVNFRYFTYRTALTNGVTGWVRNLPDGTVETLLKPENKEKLQSVLTYHVVPGKVMASDVAGLSSAKTVQGQAVKVTAKDGAVMIDDAKVVKTDIVCSNGVIHVIDKVILPQDLEM